MQAIPTHDPAGLPTVDAIDEVTLIEWPDDPGDGPAGGGLFDHLLGAYEQHGYAAGYRRAVSDVLTALLAAGEDYIRRERPAPAADLRRALLAFGDYLERRLGPAAGQGAAFVEGGLGI